ncbi:MAG: rhomboid family intramembrane serine protease [Myxococcota bacterium]
MSSTSPDPAHRPLELAPPGALWGSWGLVGALVVAHVATAVLYAERARATLVGALFLERSLRLRVTAGGQYAPLVSDGQVWRLVRSVGLHADGLHLLVNCVAIAVLGRLLEPWIGPVRLLWWFALSGVGGSIASHLAGLTQSDGASGGAFGLLGAMLVLGVRNRHRLDDEDRPIVTRWLPGFLVLNLVISVLLPFVDAVGHVGGLLVGCGLALFARPERPSRTVTAIEAVGVGLMVGIAITGPSWPP